MGGPIHFLILCVHNHNFNMCLGTDQMGMMNKSLVFQVIRIKEYSPLFGSGLHQTRGSSHGSTRPEGSKPKGQLDPLLEPRVWCNPDPNQGLYSYSTPGALFQYPFFLSVCHQTYLGGACLGVTRTQ